MTKTLLRPTRSQLARVQKIVNELRLQPGAVSCEARLALAGDIQYVTIRRDGTWVAHHALGDIEMGAKSPVRVYRNQWGNWLCYLGNVKVETYGHLFDAKTWLARMVKAGHSISKASEIGAAELADHMDLVD